MNKGNVYQILSLTYMIFLVASTCSFFNWIWVRYENENIYLIVLFIGLAKFEINYVYIMVWIGPSPTKNNLNIMVWIGPSPTKNNLNYVYIMVWISIEAVLRSRHLFFWRSNTDLGIRDIWLTIFKILNIFRSYM